MFNFFHSPTFVLRSFLRLPVRPGSTYIPFVLIFLFYIILLAGRVELEGTRTHKIHTGDKVVTYDKLSNRAPEVSGTEKGEQSSEGVYIQANFIYFAKSSGATRS